jgi:hypothetical protein
MFIYFKGGTLYLLVMEIRNYGYILNPITGVIINDVWLVQNGDIIHLELKEFSKKDDAWSVINGVFNGQNKMCLVDCIRNGGVIGAGGDQIKISPMYTIKGKHANSLSDLVFKRLSISFPAYTEWSRGQFGIKSIDEESFHIPKENVMFQTQLKDLTGVECIQKFSGKRNYNYIDYKRSTYFTFHFKEGKHINEIWELASRLRRFILFVTNRNPEYSSMALYKSFDEDDYGHDLIRSKLVVNDKRFSQALGIHHRDLEVKLPRMLKKWIDSDEIEHIYEVVQEILFNNQMGFAKHFSNLSVAIETFQEVFGDKPDIKEKIEKIELCKKILPDVQGIDSKWLVSIIGGFKKPSYMEKLRTYNDYFDFVFPNHLGLTSTKKLLDCIKDVRNDFAHRGRTDIIKGVDFIILGKSIEYLIIIDTLHFLTEDKFIKIEFRKQAKQNIDLLKRINDYKSIR